MGGVVSLSTIETRISEAETARHEIATGGLKSWTTQGGKTFTALSLKELDDYIATLKREKAEASEAETGWGAHPIQIEGGA